MDQGLRIPDAATPYILFQRTIFQCLPSKRIDTIVNRYCSTKKPIYNSLVKAEARLRPKQIKAMYAASMRREYASIRSYLLKTCRTMLDIGCGVAGIDVLIHRHYHGQQLEHYLLDRTYLEERVYYDYQAKGGFYNSLDIARTIMESNGVPPGCIHTKEATAENDVPITVPLDLVISLISWGFHYPIDTYLAQVHALLSDSGILIMDVRKNTGGLEKLREYFARIDIIQDAPKRYRIVAAKTCTH